MIGALTINLSPKYQYEPLYTTHAARKDLWGGRGRGGSHEGTLYALQRLTTPVYYRIAFLRKVYKDVRSSLWADFKDRINEAGLAEELFDMADHEMRCTFKPTGNTINSFGVKAEGGRTAKLKSLAGYNLIIIEEANELTEEEFNTIDDSLRTIKGPAPEIVLIFNPPGRMHWIWKNYNLIESEIKGYWKAIPKQGVNMLSIYSNYRENITNITPAKIVKWESYKTTNPEYYYTMIVGLISEGQRGRIYDGWMPITMQQFLDVDAQEIIGQDFGTVHPAGTVGVKVVNTKVYVRELNYDPLTDKQIGIKYCMLGITGKDIVIADCEDAVAINKLRNGWTRNELSQEEIEMYPQLIKGFYILACIKGPGSKVFGINAMKDMEVFVTEDSLNVWEEYRDYKWALDKDKNPTDMPEDIKNDLMDPIRYVVTAKGRLW